MGGLCVRLYEYVNRRGRCTIVDSDLYLLSMLYYFKATGSCQTPTPRKRSDGLGTPAGLLKAMLLVTVYEGTHACIVI